MKLPPDAKRWLPFALLGAAGLGAALLMLTRPRVEPVVPEPVRPLVRVQSAIRSELQFRVRAQGTVAPRTESELIAQVAGEVIWVSPAFVSGGFFAVDEPLVRLDPADAEAELESARAGLARAESEFDRASKERARQRRLADRSVASQSRIDDAENAYRIAEAARSEARARAARAERDLARTELRAPYAGRVRQQGVDVGQFVNRGTTLGTLYAVDYAEVRLPIPDRELRYLDLPLTPPPAEAEAPPQQPVVELSAEFAGESATWTGRIVRTEGEIDPKSRMVHVVARVEDPYGLTSGREGPPLAVGLFVAAEILGRTQSDVFVLPTMALREDGAGDPTLVYVIDAEDRLHFRRVEVLRRERGRVVVGSGLADGERVCISPLAGVLDGMSVRVDAAAADDLARSGS
ncbi:MAG: efflux RND transporter periplasmic adaptor subunit [Proteobacteria bacterium]|nr:efflux RND transporter periplasmic adaptor subunit [Pseudomonadota bacterium]